MTIEQELALLQAFLDQWIPKEEKPSYAKDCFFFEEDQDMNATLPYCAYQHDVYPRGCCETCKQYVSKQQARDLVLAYVSRKGRTAD